ncbi:Thioredoxin-2 [Fragariocoptes setiger]|uniref:Thioredoxin n=1 Tax=Fragariocoptes setiger TaxID=1670756 RepID=A0ABQ7SCH9_9ACAR|nr:Thioredoxin-2 [Fragariocoptes setiger]
MAPYLAKNKADFESQLKAAEGKLVVIDFFATWCGPCKLMSPIFADLSEHYKDSVIFLTVDVDECEDLASEYEVSVMPTFVFIKNMKKLTTVSGASEAKLKSLLNKYK